MGSRSLGHSSYNIPVQSGHLQLHQPLHACHLEGAEVAHRPARVPEEVQIWTEVDLAGGSQGERLHVTHLGFT